MMSLCLRSRDAANDPVKCGQEVSFDHHHTFQNRLILMLMLRKVVLQMSTYFGVDFSAEADIPFSIAHEC